MNHASGKASNAVLAKARALYGRRLRAEDYRRLTDCHTMTELANELKALPLYANTLAEVNPTYARRAQLENLLRQSQYERFDSLCRRRHRRCRHERPLERHEPAVHDGLHPGALQQPAPA